ncbi:hypothetical protein EIN_341940 [Entamoeba invadens IP1]|uniref:Uncharacterized protein n=1 Tax=Entamoeba invadens IP1 TaxID=370355 RepID=A0A0A1UH64_ENTIV|nr:hypothetical protein EIN_341940 [Entamoeba invadens IP1]ELP94776.1 hypothetical protein EIN_341940 [Entamoeba invadens IP1]|eukprot:XP_004261547.1 hypothetical protein EIN_341940 [Entamoeba invadens IP1]
MPKAKQTKKDAMFQKERIDYLLKISSLMAEFHPVTGQHCGLAIRDMLHKTLKSLTPTWRIRFCRRCWTPHVFSKKRVVRRNKKPCVVLECSHCKHKQYVFLTKSVKLPKPTTSSEQQTCSSQQPH